MAPRHQIRTWSIQVSISIRASIGCHRHPSAMPICSLPTKSALYVIMYVLNMCKGYQGTDGPPVGHKQSSATTPVSSARDSSSGADNIKRHECMPHTKSERMSGLGRALGRALLLDFTCAREAALSPCLSRTALPTLCNKRRKVSVESSPYSLICERFFHGGIVFPVPSARSGDAVMDGDAAPPWPSLAKSLSTT